MLRTLAAVSLLAAGQLLLSGCALVADLPATSPATQVPQTVYRSPAPVYGDDRAEHPLLLERRRPLPAALLLHTHRGPASSQIQRPLKPLAPGSLWNRLRAGYALAPSDSPRVKRALKWYASHPDYLQRVTERARPYMHFIVDAVEARGMPAELALLPIVESAFNVFAYSPGRAAGVWQFIPATGRRYGLKQNWWYDGRRDVYAATHAALDYLQALHQRFDGDWLHALGAYNAGAGNISKAIERNRKRGKPIDFFHLQVPRETRSYVPKLLALSQIFRAPAAFGVTIDDIADAPVFAKVATDGQLDLAVAARLADMSIEDLYLLNPGFNRWATDPDGPHYLLLPLDSVARFRQGLRDLSPAQRVTFQRHRVENGETLSHIAERYRTTVGHLRSINNLRGTLIRAGHHLLVPHAARDKKAYALSSEQRVKRVQAKTRKGHKLVHRVGNGDTLWDLASQYGVTPAKIANWNGLSVRDVIRPGQNLVLWVNKSAASRPPNNLSTLPENRAVQRINYVVRQGDSLSRIANRFKVSVDDLRRWNGPKLRGKYLQPGQRLQVYIDVRRQSG